MTTVQLQQLKAEIQTDPVALGYAAVAGDTQDLADKLNAIRPGSTIQRSTIASAEFVNCLVLADYVALSDPQRAYVALIALLPNIPTTAGNQVRTNLLAIFGVGTATRGNVAAIVQRTGTRAEELFGAGVSVAHADVAAALAS
jgi:hypothetical protein